MSINPNFGSKEKLYISPIFNDEKVLENLLNITLSNVQPGYYYELRFNYDQAKNNDDLIVFYGENITSFDYS